MEKTIKEWLETLPEPYRTDALENAHKTTIDSDERNLHEAIHRSFVWSCSPQGHEYWDDVRNRAEAGEFNNNSLDKDSEK